MTLYRFKNILQPTQAALFDDSSRMSIVGGPKHPNPLAMAQTAAKNKSKTKNQGIDEKIDLVLKKLESHDRRFDQVDKRFDDIDKRLDGHDKRLDGHDKEFELHGEMLRNIVGILSEHTRKLNELPNESTWRMDVNRILSGQDKIVEKYERLEQEQVVTSKQVRRIEEHVGLAK